MTSYIFNRGHLLVKDVISGCVLVHTLFLNVISLSLYSSMVQRQKSTPTEYVY